MSIEVTSGQPMKPSHDVQDHVRGTEIYHLCGDVERLNRTEGESAMRHSESRYDRLGSILLKKYS
jgi:hypothetical protein